MPRVLRRTLLTFTASTLSAFVLSSRADPVTEHGGAREAPSVALGADRSPVSLAEHAMWSLSRRDLHVGLTNADHDDSYVYRFPYADGVSYPVLQGYGSRLSHRGSEYFTVDFGMQEGTLVYSARGGTVMLVEDSRSGHCWADGCGRLANFIVVLHSDGTTGEYFHLQKGSALVSPGEHVARGQPLARSGNTGYSTAPHLHFGVYRPAADGTTQSIAVRFLARDGLVEEPRTGARYENAQSSLRAGH